ncbi:MAG: AAA family ATPase [Defluviimonas sp.]|nr:AAA family ATPase [Defluviimonas sp.]
MPPGPAAAQHPGPAPLPSAPPHADAQPAPQPDAQPGAQPVPNFYTAAFGLTERPFSLVPDPAFLYWTPAHRRAFTVLEYGVASHAPITVITGEIGTGKTTLLQALLRILPETARIGLVSNAHGGRGELLRWVLNALDVPHEPGADYVALFQRLQDVLLDEYARGNHTVLIVDEAQNLTPETLEELRMLTNVNSNKDELLQLILVGQPELRDMIEAPGLRQFAQRVGASFHLTPMSAETTGDYIAHRLRHAGGRGDEFAPEAVALIHDQTDGVPRLVNKICDLALLYAAASEQARVTAETVSDVLGEDLFIRTRPAAPQAASAAEGSK